MLATTGHVQNADKQVHVLVASGPGYESVARTAYSGRAGIGGDVVRDAPVSYTHLTLPTICSV
eukprot:5364436-Alexandrium_andersonii.AAC.1